MPQCSVPECKSRTTRKEWGVTFHRFPNDEDRRKEWVNAMQRHTDWKVPKFAYVCSKHFHLQDFDLTSPNMIRLRKNAVPTVVVPVSTQLHSEPAEQCTSSSSGVLGSSHGTSPGPIASVPGSTQQLHGEPSEQCASLSSVLLGPSHAANPGLIVLKTLLLPASCATLVANVSHAATSLMLKDHGAMPADVDRSREGSCSQWTQANVTTGTIGTQCGLRFSISAEAQTETEFSGNTAEAPVRQPENPFWSGCPWSSNTRTWANNHKTQFRGELHFLQSCQRNHEDTTFTSYEQVDASKMSCQKELSHKGVHTAVKKPYLCNICQKNFGKKGELDEHVRLHSGEKSDVCRVSHQSFTQSGHVASPERVHTGEESSEQNFFQESLARKVKLVEDERLYSSERPYICSICKQDFAQRWNLVRHERAHTGEKPYACDVCQKSFTRKGILAEHMRVHTGERPYKCDVCHKSFAQKGVLVSHKRVHTGEKPYVCTACQKSFSDKGHLANHEKLHTGERPYICNFCQKRFVDKHSLSRHEKVHTGKTLYKCGVCQKRFVQSWHLTRHKRVHTGERPYVCTICEKSFAEKGHLVKHQRRHTGKRP